MPDLLPALSLVAVPGRRRLTLEVAANKDVGEDFAAEAAEMEGRGSSQPRGPTPGSG